MEEEDVMCCKPNPPVTLRASSLILGGAVGRVEGIAIMPRRCANELCYDSSPSWLLYFEYSQGMDELACALELLGSLARWSSELAF